MPETNANEAQLKVSDIGDTPRVYCNNVQVTASQWDFTFYFGEIVQDNPQAKVADVKSRAVVIMSPQHAKVFAEVLLKTVQQWEEGTKAASAAIAAPDKKH